MTSECGVRLTELERYACGELAEDRHQEIEKIQDSCAHCQTELERLSREKDEFLASVNVAAQSAQILEKLEVTPPQFWIFRGHFSQWVGALTLVVAMAFIVPTVLKQDPLMNRTKGAKVGLQVYLNSEGEARLIAQGSKLKEGDQIQFKYQARGFTHLMIISVDGRNTISSLYPSAPGSSVSITPEGSHVLKGSIVLDDALGPEKVYAIYSKQALDYVEVERLLKSGAGLQDSTAFGIGTEFVQFSFEKVK